MNEFNDKNNIEKFIGDTRSLALSDAEKKRLKNVVFSYLAENPLTVKLDKPVPSTWNTISFISSKVSWGVYTLASVLIFVGITQAAERSIPGDTLYAVKVNINEPVLKGMSFTGAAKAKTYATIAERRLIEIEKVSLKSAQQDEVLSNLNEDFKENAEKVHDYVSELQSKGDITSADEVNSDFKTTLSTHSEILDSVDSTHTATNFAASAISITASSTTRMMSMQAAPTTPLSPIISEIQNQNDRTATQERNLDAAIASSTDENRLRDTAEKRLKVSEDKIEQLRDYIDSVQSKVPPTAGVNLTDEEQKLKEAEETYAEAEEKLEQNNVREAIELSSKARETAQEAMVRARVESELSTIDDVDISPLE